VSAALTITPRPGVGAGVKEYVIDCPHGTTTGLAVDGRIKMSDDGIVLVMLARHDAAERCGCTRDSTADTAQECRRDERDSHLPLLWRPGPLTRRDLHQGQAEAEVPLWAGLA
jgi:hypothetical protein